jgi:hypothetical protein
MASVALQRQSTKSLNRTIVARYNWAAVPLLRTDGTNTALR